MSDVLIYGDTARSAELRHEVPLAIGNPFLHIERDGGRIILTNDLERARIAAVVPDAELRRTGELGFYDLLEAGLSRADASPEVAP